MTQDRNCTRQDLLMYFPSLWPYILKVCRLWDCHLRWHLGRTFEVIEVDSRIEGIDLSDVDATFGDDVREPLSRPHWVRSVGASPDAVQDFSVPVGGRGSKT